MELSLNSLVETGSLSDAAIKKEVKWKAKGKEHTAHVWVRPLSYHSAVSEVQAYNRKQDGMAARIAACIVNEHGQPLFTTADVMGTADPARGPFCESLTLALLALIGEVNDLGKTTGSAT
jgi:hypothetical protein